ncbi:MAG: radical SAM protein [bacterium]|nr:radical SAM protein [bacterium]
MNSFFNPFSQGTIKVTDTCNLRCRACTLWRKDYVNSINSDTIINLIKKNKFFNIYSRKKIFNIIGGDPLCSADLPCILSFLKRNNIKINIWTHGIHPYESFEKTFMFSDNFFIYLPSPDPDEYREVSGNNGLSQFKDTVNFLLENKKNIIINFPINTSNIQLLPDVYEIIYEKKIYGLFHYNNRDNFSSDSKKYIKRFYNIRNILVYKSISMDSLCTSFPAKSLNNPVHYYKNFFFELFNSLRQKYTL